VWWQDKLSAIVNTFDVRDAAHLALVPQLAMDQQGSRFIQQVLYSPAVSCLFWL
jgi:hypothetical protein